MTSKTALVIAFKESTLGECGWFDITGLCEKFKKAGKPSSITYVRSALAVARSAGWLEEKIAEEETGRRGRKRLIYRLIPKMKIDPIGVVTKDRPDNLDCTGVERILRTENITSIKALGDMFLGEIVQPPEEHFKDPFKAAVPDRGIAFRERGLIEEDDLFILPRHEILRRAMREQKIAYLQPVPASELELERLVRRYAR